MNQPNGVRVLGVDPGYARCGWGIVEMRGDPYYIAHGCVETPANMLFEKRLECIGKEISKVIVDFKPQRMAVEQIFFVQSKTTGLGVAHARGVLLYCAAQHGLAIDEMTPTQVKTNLTGYGRADKNQMQTLVKMQLQLKEIPQPDDSADALAVAICSAVCFRTMVLSTQK